MTKTIGLIGGISWHATLKYYELINQAVNEHFGDNTNPPLLIYNVNQSKMHKMQRQDDWQGIADLILQGAKSLALAGANILMICSNTTHKVHPLIKEKIGIPFLHIGDAIANHIQSLGFNKVGFIGTRFAIEDQFLLDHIRNFNIDVLAPKEVNSILELHRIIHEELTYNKVLSNSIDFVKLEVEKMAEQGIQGVILGCTEFSLMFDSAKLDIPILDTIAIHANAATSKILG